SSGMMTQVKTIPKGCGFIDYDDEESAQNAIDNFDNKDLLGRSIRVTAYKAD
ncbi:hypothetical protein AAVH_31302, partial [Aphelenchoides avenae]